MVVVSRHLPDPLVATIARTERAIAASAPEEAWPWRFARCWMLATRVEEHGGTVDEIDGAIAEFHLLPGDAPARTKLAAQLVVAQQRRSMLDDYGRVRRAVALADIANTDPAPLPAWPKADAALRATCLHHRLTRGAEHLSAEQALRELDRYAVLIGDEQPYALMVDVARTHALMLRARERGDFTSMEDALVLAESLRQQHGANPLVGPRLTITAEFLRAMMSMQRGSMPGVEAALERMDTLLDETPPGGPWRAGLEEMIASLRSSLAVLHAGLGVGVKAGVQPDVWGPRSVADGPLPPEVREFHELATQRPASGAETTSHRNLLGLIDLLREEPESMDRAVAQLRSATETGPHEDPNRRIYLMNLGLALAIRYEDRRNRADLTEATKTLSRARDLLGSPADPHWALCVKNLGHLYRLSGRIIEGCALGLDGLRGHAYSVLLQSDTAGRTNAGRDAAEDAVDVARWFLAEGEPAGAATALETGRSLALFAMTEHRTVADRLLAAGRADLAERWRDATRVADAGHVPIELRRAALEVFIDRLEPPGLPQVQLALRALSLDALVYLVPGDNGTGAAVIVPAHGAARQVMLPHLHRAHMPDLASVALPGERRDAHARGVASLDDVCGWAWKAVVDPVLRRVSGVDGRSPRLALVPMRELATVPWHAACTVEAGRTVRAVERAAFSYVPSARLLCATAAAEPVPLDDRGLVVGDPDTGGRAEDLVAARVEAWAVRQRFYPTAAYVGRTGDGDVGPDGPGRPKDVLGWLSDPTGGTVLHLACHAVVDPAPASDDPDPGQANDTAYLVLSDGERLAAEHVVARRAVGLVVLGACNSGVAARGGHDEAFSLAATFLVAGARTVVSSLWSVPDDATSVLMYLFHHHLRAGLAPIDALRRAQLWMLDPHRQAPDDMPAPLRARLAGTDPSDVDAWAGFFHIGR